MSKLDELRARKAAAVAAVAAAAPVVDEEASLEREVVEAEAHAAAVAKHGAAAVATVDTDQGLVVLHRVPGAVMRKFQDAAKYDTTSVYTLVVKGLSYPETARFDVMLDTQPLILGRCCDALLKLAGARVDELAGK